jgi:hypothetical protein
MVDSPLALDRRNYIQCGGCAVEAGQAGGDRANADARDGAQLTRLLRLGEITAVTVPECDVEAVRDLVRPAKMPAPA